MTASLLPHADAPPVGTELPAHHVGCFGCGDVECGLQLRFRVVAPLRLGAVVTLAPHHQGAPGLAHGGVLAAVFDEALGAVQVFTGERAVTAGLTTDYRRPVPIGVPLHVRADLDSRDGRKLWTSATARLDRPDGPVAATARALFMVVPPEHFTRHLR